MVDSLNVCIIHSYATHCCRWLTYTIQHRTQLCASSTTALDETERGFSPSELTLLPEMVQHYINNHSE